ncbi:hypothetical protein AFE_1715 [Acidithiobacillus ferrooxidans ATCC 23270]|uniref:Uncharacterized protein n=1 Tax=Acidithiobacillus ferrooxidans (strain ATCC 23270 / DSM 14882 / CIP 104768 / NCIMB 8455) TaxID=243159 RepID=B7JB52_ACIF2|nr:hypothetical protein AFE_1715 [Acidithiobacillus ferrooxidans ATCC 23270]
MVLELGNSGLAVAFVHDASPVVAVMICKVPVIFIGHADAWIT